MRFLALYRGGKLQQVQAFAEASFERGQAYMSEGDGFRELFDGSRLLNPTRVAGIEGELMRGDAPQTVASRYPSTMIQVVDMVLTRNPETGLSEYKRHNRMLNQKLLASGRIA